MEPVLPEKQPTKTEEILETTEYDPVSKIHKTIRRKGNVLLDVTEKDAKGALRRTEYDGARVTCVTEVDENGHLKRMTCAVGKSKRARTYTFEYDDNGYLVRQKAPFAVPMLSPVTEWWRKPARQTYFPKWNGKALSFEEGFEPDVNEYEGMTKGFFENGQIVRVIAYDFLDHPRHVKRYRKGELAQESIYEIRGGLSIQRWYGKHKEGSRLVRVMSERVFDGKDNCVGTTFIETTMDSSNKPQLAYVYTNGALSKRIIYCVGNKKYPGEKIECDYNKEGQCVEERFLTMSDKVISVVRYEYNRFGRCLDSYKWNGHDWVSEKRSDKTAPKELSAPPAKTSALSNQMRIAVLDQCRS